MGDYGYVHVWIEDRVAVLEIDHPPVNALDRATFDDLEAAFSGAVANARVKAIIVTGAGRSFVAGADIDELSTISSANEARELAQAGQALCNKIERAPKPVIAAINGRYCLGGGNELALACHIRIAEERAKLGQPEITLGLIPGWGATQRLTRLVGAGRAAELILTGEPVRAAEACAMGLVNKVVPEGQALQEALRVAKRMAALSSVALAKALDAIYTGADLGLDQGLAYEAMRFSEMAETEDMGEGLSAFIEKRRPEFKDR